MGEFAPLIAVALLVLIGSGIVALVRQSNQRRVAGRSVEDIDRIERVKLTLPPAVASAIAEELAAAAVRVDQMGKSQTVQAQISAGRILQITVG